MGGMSFSLPFMIFWLSTEGIINHWSKGCLATLNKGELIMVIEIALGIVLGVILLGLLPIIIPIVLALLALGIVFLFESYSDTLWMIFALIIILPLLRVVLHLIGRITGLGKMIEYVAAKNKA